ncbi:hypothetical protein B0T24DRAFT_610717 [Lasiosphaeria ovina]|uniref:BTB domain-containing protein n=1 Tax=Lasiosphaeria ovina TaxID=92902 RepID=A0AAE0NDI8_9PEZI|nr:hypothetical protein B0T24DRAFT_610717 [Lasiosphaeria ovina]
MSSLARAFGGRIVTIFVGVDRVKFTIHENLISESSPFFKAAFRGEFGERNGVLELPDDDPDAFELFVGWLYGKAQSKSYTIADGPIDWDIEAMTFLNLYILSKKYFNEDLSNNAIDLAYEYFDYFSDLDRKDQLEYLRHVVDNTLPGDSMRSLLVFVISVDLFQEHSEEFKRDSLSKIKAAVETSPQCVAMLLPQILSFDWDYRNGMDRPHCKSKCFYHQHETTTPCDDDD